MKARKRILAWLAVITLLGAVLCGGMTVAAEELPEATSITLNREEILMLPGKTQALQIQVQPVTGDVAGVVWTSDNENVALVANGTVEAVAKGTATITATLPNGVKDTCKVSVVKGDVIVKDGTFTAATSTWTTGGSATIEANSGRENTACVKMDYGSSLSQVLSGLKANTAYTVSADIKATEDGTSTAKLLSGDAVLAEAEVKLGKSWKTRQFHFTTAEATDNVQLVFENTNTEGAVFVVDNVVVTEKLSDADLTVTALTWEGGYGEVKPGTKLTFSAEIANVGTADVTAPFSVNISMGTKVICTLKHEGGLKAGESVKLTSKPWKAVKGDHMMAARVNPDLAVEEKDYIINNAYQINLRVARDRLAPTYNAELVAEAGFNNLTFNDDFDSLDVVDRMATGLEGYKWYVTRPFGATTLTPEDYSIKDGVMAINIDKNKYNYGLATVDIPTWNGYTHNKGYMEFRIRIPHYDEELKGSPAIWSLPENKLHNKDVEMWVEVDWMEYWGYYEQPPRWILHHHAARAVGG